METKSEKKIGQEKPVNGISNLDENELENVSGGIPAPGYKPPSYPKM